MISKEKIAQWEKEYDKYMDEFETSDYMDIDSHTRWSLRFSSVLSEVKRLQGQLEQERKMSADLQVDFISNVQDNVAAVTGDPIVISTVMELCKQAKESSRGGYLAIEEESNSKTD